MRFSEIWKTSVKAIAKNKRRSFLTMIGLVIGVSAVIMVFSIGRGFERYISEFIGLDGFDNSIAYTFSPKDFSFYETNLEGITEDDFNRIKSINGVKDVEYYDQSRNGITYADQTIDEASADGWGYFKLLKNDGTDVLYGRSILASDNLNENKVVVLNESQAKSINREDPAAIIGKSVTIKGQLFEVVGIMADRPTPALISTEEDYVWAEVPENVYKEYFDTAYSEMIMVRVNETANVNAVTDEVQDVLDDYGTQRNLGTYKSEDLAAQVDQIRVILTGITALVSVIGGISLFISGIGVMNMIYISVSERTKEIGVRRAMGGTKGNIMLQFLLEGITLTLMGGTIGYCFGMLLAFVVGLVTPFNIQPDMFTVLLAFGLSVVIGIIFSWLPAKSAAKKDIVTLLR